MKYRIDNKSKNKLSILGYGCMRFPKRRGKFDPVETEKLVLHAIEQGINYFDTAYIYGDSEKVFGSIIKKHELRNKIFLATKMPLLLIKNKTDFDKYFNKQLKRLQTDYIDYYLMHMITTIEQWEKMCALGIEKWIKEKQKQGKIKQIGFSFHGSQTDFMKIIDAYNWDFCLIQYNYMNENYQAGKAGMIKAYKKGMTVMIMEPLLGGRLAVNLPKKIIEEFKKADDNLTPAAWALNWLWNQKEITLLLSGMSNMDQLEKNIETASNAQINMLKKQEKETITKVIQMFRESYKITCTGCNYCMPCPKSINIPAVFSSYNTYYVIGKIEGLKQYFMSTAVTSGKNVSVKNCIQCGICEKACPQNIKIIKELKRCQKKIEPWWLRVPLKLVRNHFSKKARISGEEKTNVQ